MMTLGDWITLLLLFGGIFGLSRLAYQKWQPTIRLIALRLYYAVDDYVALWQEQQIEQKPRVPDTSAIVPPTEPPRTTGTEPVRNHPNDVTYLAQRRADDGSYLYSANKIAEFVGGSRGATLEAIRAARGQPEPVAADDMQLVKLGPRENYVRTGVKPLR